MATVSEVARIFGVDSDTVNHWATEFDEHISIEDNTRNCLERQFNGADLRALAQVAELWESDPDYENIHVTLNRGEQHDERFVEFARLHTPIFQEVPEEIDETWQHGVLIGGMADRHWIELAQSYKRAADSLVTDALKSEEPYKLDYPIFFLYRHCLELYLKTMLGGKVRGHHLDELIKALETQHGKSLGGWIRDRLSDFNEIDRRSVMFRYPDDVPSGELWINFYQLQLVMNRMTEAFEKHLRQERAATGTHSPPS